MKNIPEQKIDPTCSPIQDGEDFARRASIIEHSLQYGNNAD